jgi:hypothetical protein
MNLDNILLNEISHHNRHILRLYLCKVLKAVKITDIRVVSSMGLEREKQELLFHRYQVSTLQDVNSSGDRCW